MNKFSIQQRIYFVSKGKVVTGRVTSINLLLDGGISYGIKTDESVDVRLESGIFDTEKEASETLDPKFKVGDTVYWVKSLSGREVTKHTVEIRKSILKSREVNHLFSDENDKYIDTTLCYKTEEELLKNIRSY